ncbi:D-alanyl-D-alanine carboxypeptidase / D-alanyl-D-alanine-endopeptidase (penicillin-binding protein 4) [Nitrosospira sp. Nl5]|nr:D-alanyl-D-alanine carboxypeptidase / D-alanyl-D-alanine-endopeptidase (penicillin-binding protein 4) [Nitrosospira sp. Nl5]
MPGIETYNGYTWNMAQFRITIVLCFALAAAPLPAFSHNLPLSVSQALKQAGIPKSAAGIYVHEIGAAKPMLAINASVAMNPASVMKLVTTFAGLELLGPAYTWKTELYASGILNGDILQGDLIIRGYGDPRLNLENFWLLTRRLRQTGLREIAGDLVLDNSYFDTPIGDPAAFDGKPYRAYNIFPEALLVNYRTLSLRLIPRSESKTVRVVVDPLPDSLDLSNNLKLIDGKCGDWHDALGADIRTGMNGNSRASIAFNGVYPIDCGEKTLLLGLHDSPTYTFGLFRQLWTEQGGVFRGKVRLGTAPEGLLPLEVHESPPLAEIVRDINKFSNNISARQLYLALGMTSGAAASPATGLINDTGSGRTPATLAKSGAAIRQWLTSRHLHFPELIIENGSGLSRNERISAANLGGLLLAAFQSPVMPEFVSSLPITAVDGTMKKRLNGTPIASQAHIKTGSLEGVRTMAGYMLDKSGRRVAIVFFVNHPKSGNAQSAMDALLEWVYKRP